MKARALFLTILALYCRDVVGDCPVLPAVLSAPGDTVSFLLTCQAPPRLPSITSSLYAGAISHLNYGNNESCSWLLNTSSPNQILILEFSTFFSESNRDFLSIFNGTTTFATVRASLSGSLGAFTNQIPLSSTLLRFTSDNNVTAAGFEMRFCEIICSYSFSFPSEIFLLPSGKWLWFQKVK